MRENRREAAGTAPALPVADVAEDSFDVEGLVGAVRATVDDLNGASGEPAGHERVRGGERKAAARDRRRRRAGEAELRVPDVGVPCSGQRARRGSRESSVRGREVVLVPRDGVAVVRGERGRRGREEDGCCEGEDEQKSAAEHLSLL